MLFCLHCYCATLIKSIKNNQKRWLNESYFSFTLSCPYQVDHIDGFMCGLFHAKIKCYKKRIFSSDANRSNSVKWFRMRIWLMIVIINEVLTCEVVLHGVECGVACAISKWLDALATEEEDAAQDRNRVKGEAKKREKDKRRFIRSRRTCETHLYQWPDNDEKTSISIFNLVKVIKKVSTYIFIIFLK